MRAAGTYLRVRSGCEYQSSLSLSLSLFFRSLNLAACNKTLIDRSNLRGNVKNALLWSWTDLNRSLYNSAVCATDQSNLIAGVIYLVNYIDPVVQIYHNRTTE